MKRFGILALPLLMSIEAHALTFKSGGTISGGDNVKITEEVIAACATEAFTGPVSDTIQAMS